MPSAGAVLFDSTFTKVVMVKNKGEIFGFPKGHADKDETPEETARREVFEETNCKNLKFENGFKKFVSFGNIIYFFIVQDTPLDTELKSNDNEEIISVKFVNINQIDRNKMKISRLTNDMLPWLKAYSRSRQISPFFTNRYVQTTRSL